LSVQGARVLVQRPAVVVLVVAEGGAGDVHIGATVGVDGAAGVARGPGPCVVVAVEDRVGDDQRAVVGGVDRPAVSVVAIVVVHIDVVQDHVRAVGVQHGAVVHRVQPGELAVVDLGIGAVAVDGPAVVGIGSREGAGLEGGRRRACEPGITAVVADVAVEGDGVEGGVSGVDVGATGGS
jgi:hypothetical protein